MVGAARRFYPQRLGAVAHLISNMRDGNRQLLSSLYRGRVMSSNFVDLPRKSIPTACKVPGPLTFAISAVSYSVVLIIRGTRCASRGSLRTLLFDLPQLGVPRFVSSANLWWIEGIAGSGQGEVVSSQSTRHQSRRAITQEFMFEEGTLSPDKFKLWTCMFTDANTPHA